MPVRRVTAAWPARRAFRRPAARGPPSASN